MFLSGNGLVVEQGVSGGLVLAATCFDVIRGRRVQLLAYVLSHGFPDPLRLQGTSSNFLVLRVKAHQTIRVSNASWGPASSRKVGLKNGLLSRYPLVGGELETGIRDNA